MKTKQELTKEEQDILDEVNLFHDAGIAPEKDSLVAALDLKQQIEVYKSLRRLLHEGRLRADYNGDYSDNNEPKYYATKATEKVI